MEGVPRQASADYDATATAPTSPAPRGSRACTASGARSTHARCWPGSAAPAGRRDLPQGARLARVLRRRAVPPAAVGAELPPPEMAGMALDHGPAADAHFHAWCRGAPDTRSSTPACGSCSPRAGCTTGCGWRWPRSWSRTCTRTGPRGRAGSCAGCATVTSPPTSTAGSGRPAPEPTRLPTSGSSTRCSRAGSSTRRATTSAGTCRSWTPSRALQVHEPWLLPDGLPAGYPARIVDHQAERAVALERLAAVSSSHGQET